MKDAEIRAQVNRPSRSIRIAVAGLVEAFTIIVIAAVLWIVISGTASDYSSSSKAVRDAAEAGSATLGQLRSIETIGDWVLPLAFVGLGRFLLGFGFTFASILANIKLRGATMAATLPSLKARKTER